MQSKKIVRNNTSFPVQINAKLKELYDKYKKELDSDSGEDLEWAKNLKYYQYLLKELISNDIVSEEEYARGLLVYHTMGMGKTRLAVAVAMSCWDMYQPVILLPQNLKKNFKQTVVELHHLLSKDHDSKDKKAKERAAESAVAKFEFVSMDAYNSSSQMENIGANKDIEFHMGKANHQKKIKLTQGKNLQGKNLQGKTLKSMRHGGSFLQNGLNNKLLIVDEAHNFFRAIINSGSENSNARKIYEIIMSAKNLKILFLTGTPCSKDPFELVPCFNMLAGKNLLPTAYDTFYSLYVDKMTGSIINKNKLSNRILGLVSHVTHNKNSQPVEDGGVKQATDTHKQKENRDIGWFPECLPTIVSYVEMSSPQYKQYLLARDREEAEKGGKSGNAANSRKLGNVNSVPLSLPNSEKKSMGSYYVKSRMISNFSPLREYKESPIDSMPSNSFNETTSPKLKLIADRVHAAKGSVLVYSQFVNDGGLKPLTKFLQNIGMTEFTIDDIKKNSHILTSRRLASKINSFNITDDITDDITDNSTDNIKNEYIGDKMENIDNLFEGNDHIFDMNAIEEKYIEKISEDGNTSNEDIVEGGAANQEIEDEECNVCTENYNDITNDIQKLSNKEFEDYANHSFKKLKSNKVQKKKKYKGGSEKTYVIYGADLYFTQLDNRLKSWKKITKPNVDEEVSFAWGNLLPNFHYDRNFFNQKAKLKNILMNSKSIISDKSKLYHTCDKFMQEGKYIPKTYNLHTCNSDAVSPSKQKPYIVKDATSFGQKGVHIITSMAELEKYKQQLRHTSAIVSEYLTTPLLWGGKKFHFRIYVAVYVSKKTGIRFTKVFNHSDYAYKVFMAGAPFVADHYHDDKIHITGRKSTLKRHQWKIVDGETNGEADGDFYFSKEDLPTGVTFSQINKKIETMFHELIDPHLDKFEEYPECEAGFEIFGADVMLDHRGEPYVLEINAKIGYSEDYGEKEGSKEYHEKFSHDFFNFVMNVIHGSSLGK